LIELFFSVLFEEGPQLVVIVIDIVIIIMGIITGLIKSIGTGECRDAGIIVGE
jgi:hypothetical protein